MVKTRGLVLSYCFTVANMATLVSLCMNSQLLLQLLTKPNTPEGWVNLDDSVFIRWFCGVLTPTRVFQSLSWLVRQHTYFYILLGCHCKSVMLQVTCFRSCPSGIQPLTLQDRLVGGAVPVRLSSNLPNGPLCWPVVAPCAQWGMGALSIIWTSDFHANPRILCCGPWSMERSLSSVMLPQ